MKSTMLTPGFGTGDPVDTYVPSSARRFARRSSLVHSRQGRIPAIKRALVGFAAWALLGAAASATPNLVHRWSFNDGTANDSVGTANGTLFGNTTPAIIGGKLVLNPGSDQNQYMKTSAFTGETLGVRTLVAWVTLSDLNQPGGAGVLGIHPDGVDNFDSIVYGERVAKQWMNGSNGFNRTVADNGGAAETSTGELMMAIVYDSDNSIKLYRNGVRYDTNANAGALVTRTAPIAILGRRQQSSDPGLQGAINEARIYDYALTDVEIQELNTLGPDILPGGAGINITASAGTGGAISPAGVRGVPLNSTPIYTITPGIGYNVADVVLDGTTSLGPVTTYTFPAVTAARTINATFVAVSPHTITASAGTNGSISPTGAVSVAHRDSQTFTITPNSGYVVADVVLDAGTGSETHLGPVATYTFANVQTDHTITATFFAGSLVHRWSFNDSTANDSVGTAHGTLFGNTPPAITGGKLVLNPGSDQNQYMKTSAFTGETLGVRTLVAWVAVSNLNQEGGAGVLGIHPAGVDHFDSIVYGERVAKQWMNGSNFFARTVANNGGAVETSTGEVMMAIVYDSDNSIKLYRNGVRYDTNANQGTLQTRTAPIAILGRRQENSPPELQGAINEARIYNYALTDVEIQELSTLGADTLPGETGVNITASAGTGGAISPNGVSVAPLNSTPAFTIIPGIGYDVSDVLLDGSTSLGAVTTYTFAPVTVDHTIAASFVAVSPHTITASAGTGGSISPTGAGSVAHRDSQTFTITPNSGYLVADVVLDAGTGSETSLGPVATYTFANVQANHTISATFVAGALVHQWTFNDGTANDSVGTAHGALSGTATISAGKLSLSGSSGNNRMAATLDNAMGPNKTLVAWCSLSSLTPNDTAGGPLSVGNNQFDAIVYGERTGGQWMSGSGGFLRTPPNNGGVLETLIAPDEIMMVITYDSFATNKIKLYRNGVLYGEHNQGSLVSHAAGERVLIGPRAQSSFNSSIYDGYMNGDINEARIYNYALTASEVAALYTQGPDTQPGGFAGWASDNAPGQTPSEDFDNDGVQNGLEYFMGETGSSFTSMPGLDVNNMISWPAEDGYQGTYEVQTSTDLATWTNVAPRPTPSGGILSYTLPTGAPGGKSFVRLLVTPTTP